MKKNKLIFSTATEKFIKKINDKQLKNKFRSSFEKIEQNPHEVGILKKGDLAGIYGYDLFHNRTNYEIAYSTEEDNEGIVILARTREQFYQELNRYIKNYKMQKK